MKVYESRHVANCDEPKKKHPRRTKKATTIQKKNSHDEKTFFANKKIFIKYKHTRAHKEDIKKDNDLSDSLRHMS